ncbi:hypothetical protein SERLA73DRAFT_146334 [Serpula lacrymans var. lacrymans S7.3]|uniref:Uncharacterized protein n=1 Tax=Serpula lacrymans var. lacrymans (strain S7.3) TaxID=936435 RepID=F8QFG5_SERL3|nr:hypothetical protein SERLA73DRAFT_146334 [Serpula lacrymans var. lacrymans S7.3]
MEGLASLSQLGRTGMFLRLFLPKTQYDLCDVCVTWMRSNRSTSPFKSGLKRQNWRYVVAL